MILVWLLEPQLEANYTLNILVFLHWWQIILRTFPFFLLAARLQTHTICSQSISNNSLYSTMLFIIRVESLLHIGTTFLKENSGGGLIFLQNWRQRPHFPTKLAAARILQHYWRLFRHGLDIGRVCTCYRIN